MNIPHVVAFENCPFKDKIWLVGGAVRDHFMGLEPKDYDFVVEQVSLEEFRASFPDAPLVGSKPNSPPVFKIDGHEVALARIETKTGNLYQDYSFVTGVTIREDLARRDFTIGSIAVNYVTREVYDPFMGVADIHRKIIRCVNPTAFSEDPLRIYRGIRFAARFRFPIEHKTKELMMGNVHNLIFVLRERVVLELEKVYKECERPSEFFYGLRLYGGLSTHFDELTDLICVPAGPVKFHGSSTAFDHSMDAFDYAKRMGYSFDVAIAALLHDTGKAKTPEEEWPHHYGHEAHSVEINRKFVEANKFSAHTNKLILAFAEHHMKFHTLEEMRPVKVIRFYRQIKNMFHEMMACANCDQVLNAAQLKILHRAATAVKQTVISPPEGCKDIKAFVENKYVETYRRLSEEKG